MSKPAQPHSATSTRAPRWAWALVLVWALATLGSLAWLDYQNMLRGVICMPRR